MSYVDNYFFSDFTEDNYRNILKIGKNKYNFIRYEDYKKDGKHILWRHDIDFSVHRALRLAQIEREEEVTSTFFIYLHSNFYNVFEKEITEVIFKILELGHDIGLHFDQTYYGFFDSVIKGLKFDKIIIEELFGIKIKAFSFHDPEHTGGIKIENEKICKMINVYSSYFKQHWAYCSDSNGYWRFQRLEDVLKEGNETRLQILTHPGWWVPNIMPPRERVKRCIDGRAKNQLMRYDDTMKKYGRENIS